KVSVTIDASASPATFAKSKQQLAGAATGSGVGDAAFYLPGTATLHFLKGRNAGVIQADFRMPHGMPRNPSQVQADSIVLAKVMAAHLSRDTGTESEPLELCPRAQDKGRRPARRLSENLRQVGEDGGRAV